MKKILIFTFCFVFLSCCAKPPRAVEVTVPTIAPKVEAVSYQAKKTSHSAERTVELAKVVESKIPNDRDVKATTVSAIETLSHSRATEEKLVALKVHAEVTDSEAKRVEAANSALQNELKKQDSKIAGLEQKIKELSQKLATKNWMIISLGLFSFGLICLITKPWKYFI